MKHFRNIFYVFMFRHNRIFFNSKISLLFLSSPLKTENMWYSGIHYISNTINVFLLTVSNSYINIYLFPI